MTTAGELKSVIILLFEGKTKYSKKKFQSFSLEKQIKIYLEFIREIEKNWHDETLRFELLKNFLDCINYAEKELKIQIEKTKILTANIKALRNKLENSEGPWSPGMIPDMK